MDPDWDALAAWPEAWEVFSRGLLENGCSDRLTSAQTGQNGIGYAWIDANIKDSIDPGFGVCQGNRCDVDDSFTVNVGIGPVFKVGKVNIRILNRWRYFDERDDDEIDSELSIGVLFPLGGS